MRISIKHLLLGMTFGSVVVLFYGYIKLSPQNIKPQNQKQEQVASNLVTHKNVDNNEIIEPRINLITNNDTQTQVQFIEFNRLKNDPLEVIKANPSPTSNPTPIQPKPTQTESNQNVIQRQTQTINAPQEVISLIEKYAGEYSVDKNMMIGIAKCESGFRENAVNGPYAGIYQFVSGTWVSNRRAMGLDENLDLRYNAEESVRTAAFKMSRDGFGAWPVCQYKAKGLIVADTQNL